MDDKPDPLEGFFAKMRPLVRESLEKTFPASAVTLSVLRTTKPELAKRIFVEAVIAPAKEAIADYLKPETIAVFEEIESRFRQDGITSLYYDVEMVVVTRMISEMFVRIEPTLERFFHEPGTRQGRLTSAGIQLSRWLARDARFALVDLANKRERRVQLLLTAEIAGEDVVTDALEKFGGYQRDIMMEAIWRWLGCSLADDDKKRRLVADYIAAGSDEKIVAMLHRLEGHAFLSENDIWNMVHEVFTGEEHIEF